MGATSSRLHAMPRLFPLAGEEQAFSIPLPVLLAAIAGAWALAMVPVLHTSWQLWMGDPLRSIGMFFPPLSAFLILRAWRGLEWQRAGSWWGLAPLLVAVLGVLLRAAHSLTLQRGDLAVNLLADGPILALSAAGVLLLLGGPEVLKKCLFPVLLLLCVNPVPTSFNTLLDLPLQHASAATARHFALLIGERPDGEQLRLMFTPDFGMFIAPGCNGIRGAVTFAYIALIASYWRGFSLGTGVLAGLSGMALGYLFNFVRLCVLVVYYKAGRSFTLIQPYGALIDYIIGGTLFLGASIGFGLFLFRKQEIACEPKLRFEAHRPPWLATALILILLGLGASNVAAVTRDARDARIFSTHVETTLVLPHEVGAYRLIAQWTEGESYLWGRYSNGKPGEDVSLGLWQAMGYHDALACHLAAGEKTSFGPMMSHRDVNGAETAYRSFTFDDGLSNVYAASKICPDCDRSAPEHWFGPFHVVSRSASSYFRNPFMTGVLLTHDAGTSATTQEAGYGPLRAFVASLNDNTLIASSKP